LLALLEVLLALILALSLSLGALVLPGLPLLGGPEPRAALVLLLRRRVAIELAGTSTGPVVTRRPLTAEGAARCWSAVAEAAPTSALAERAAARWSAAREATAA